MTKQQLIQVPLDLEISPSEPVNLIALILPITRQLLQIKQIDSDYEIIRRRFKIGLKRIYTLDEIGGYLAITRERVRQRESRAISFIREHINGNKKNVIIPTPIIEEFQGLKKALQSLSEVITEPQVVIFLQERYVNTLNEAEYGIVSFLMELLEFDFISPIEPNFNKSWITTDQLSKNAFMTAQKALYKACAHSAHPQELFDIMSSVNKGRRVKLSQKIICLAITTYEALELVNNKYQIRFINLESLADKAYRILDEKQDPLSAQEICMEINHRMAMSKSSRQASSQSLSQQLTNDKKRFYPLGNGGLWALSERKTWTSATIVHIMKEYLNQKKACASVDEIFEYVKQKRPDVDRKSIQSFFGQKDKFTRMSPNCYVPKEWKWKGIEPNMAARKIRSSPMRDLVKKSVISILERKPNRNMELEKLRDQVMKETKCPSSTFYRYLKEMNNIDKTKQGRVFYCQLSDDIAKLKPMMRPIGDWLTLIQKGESNTVEFKQAAKWNEYENKVDGNMIQGIIQEIVGFMNVEGGYIFIGIDDKTQVIKGINDDYQAVNKKKPNRDGYELYLRDSINQKIGSDLASYYQIDFQKINSKDVCCITVRSAPRVVFYDKDLYLRAGNQANKLNASESIDFVRRREDELGKNKRF